MGIILDSSILVAAERRRLDLDRLLTDHSPAAIAAITAGELRIGVERADTPERRALREAFVETLIGRLISERKWQSNPRIKKGGDSGSNEGEFSAFVFRWMWNTRMGATTWEGTRYGRCRAEEDTCGPPVLDFLYEHFNCGLHEVFEARHFINPFDADRSWDQYEPLVI